MFLEKQSLLTIMITIAYVLILSRNKGYKVQLKCGRRVLLACYWFLNNKQVGKQGIVRKVKSFASKRIMISARGN